MYNLVEWRKDLDLSYFYRECKKRGFENNTSQEKMIDCFRNEKNWNAWILYFNDTPIGSVAAHSFDEVMGDSTYRILTRTCSFREFAPIKGLTTTKKLIEKHQNFTDQFFLPKCLEWTGDARVFATSNESNVASQRLVNNYYFPTLHNLGLVEKIDTVYYRGLRQQVWEVFKKPFLQHLNLFPRWNQ